MMSRRRHRHRSVRISVLLLLAALAGCGGLDLAQTGVDAYTITAGGDGGYYSDFQSKALGVCPQGFHVDDAIRSKDSESQYSQWKIRCLTLVIHGSE